MPLGRGADFLMQYVKKDKLTELLAEKLCARLAASETTRQARAVSYCLGQLKVRRCDALRCDCPRWFICCCFFPTRRDNPFIGISASGFWPGRECCVVRVVAAASAEGVRRVVHAGSAYIKTCACVHSPPLSPECSSPRQGGWVGGRAARPKPRAGVTTVEASETVLFSPRGTMFDAQPASPCRSFDFGYARFLVLFACGGGSTIDFMPPPPPRCAPPSYRSSLTKFESFHINLILEVYRDGWVRLIVS